MDYRILCVIFAACALAQGQDRPQNHLRQLLDCGLAHDVGCFVDIAEELLNEKRAQLLTQADSEIVKVAGRSDEEESPSQLSSAINSIIAELTDMFRDGISGFFKSAREDDVEAEEDEDKEPAKRSSPRDSVGEGRKKKKKKKLIGLIKLLIIGLVLKAKLTLLLKALSAALQLKFFMVALAGLILNAARFYLDLKKGHQPQKVIYYEHAQHQHHYDGGDEEWSSGPGGGYWGRSYDLESGKTPHDAAYSKQKPSRVEDSSTPGISWLG